jgi:hypothetical protein
MEKRGVSILVSVRCDGAFRWIVPAGWGGRDLVRPGLAGCGGAFTEITPELPPDPDSSAGSIPCGRPFGSADAGLERSADAKSVHKSIQQPNVKNDLIFIALLLQKRADAKLYCD